MKAILPIGSAMTANMVAHSRPPDPNRIPLELRERPQWVCWRYEERGDKLTKVPIDPVTLDSASATNPATWTSFIDAMRTFEAQRSIAGVGYVFAVDDPFCGVDLDRSRDAKTGQIKEWAQSIIDRLASYTEVSPSSSGVKIWLRAKKPGDRCKLPSYHGGAIEIYESGRFFTVTGQSLTESPPPLDDRQDALNEIYQQLFSTEPPKQPPVITTNPSIVLAFDSEVIARARSAANGTRFTQLWEGAWEAAGYGSQSEADAALLSMLRFWTSGDKQRAFRLFEKSGLNRSKWKREDYREKTWTAVNSGDVYNPKRPPPPPETDAKAKPDEWQPFLPFDSAAATPPFPLDALPEPYRSFAFEVSESRQVPPDLPATLILGAVAIAAAKRWKVFVGGTHDEPLNIYVLSLMEPGERKSATFRDVLRPVEEYESKLRALSDSDVRRLEERRRLEEAELEEIRRRAAKTEDSIRKADLKQQAEELAMNLTSIPSLPQLIASDVTPEKLVSLCFQNGGRIAQADAEGGTFFNMVNGQYAKNGTGNFEVYLRGHAGDRIRVDRTTRAAEFINEPAITLLLCGQPDILRRIQNREVLRGRGLLARFLYSLPESKVGTRQYRNRPIGGDYRDAYHHALHELFSMPDPATPEDPDACHTLRITGEGLQLWAEESNASERTLAPEGRLAHVKDWGAKLSGVASRIAGLLHLMSGSREVKIEQTTIAAAWTLARYFENHALAAFELMGGGIHDDLARRILGWIRRNVSTKFSLAECYNMLRHGEGVATADDLLPALSILESRNFIRELPDATAPRRGRKPSPSFTVNPATHAAD